MKALVLGHAGFVGRHMTAELRDRGWTVAGVDIRSTWGPTRRDALEVFRGDHLRGERYDLVVHAAAVEPHRKAIDSRPMHLAANLQLDAAMFEWAVRTGQGRVLYLSSCAVLDGPDDYGWCKLTGERMAAAARKAGTPVIVVRPYSGYGEDQGEDWPFGAFAARARRREDPFTIWGDGTQVRDWIHVDDLVNGALAVVESGTTDPVNLCTGVGTSMRELVAMMCAQVGYEPDFELKPDAPAGVAYRVGEPSRMLQYYTPTVSLEEGVKRALA